MLFSSVSFIFMFLPAVLLLYHLLPKRFRNYVLLGASLFFYAWGEPKYLLILLAVITVNYFGALLIDKYRQYGKLWLAAAICCNLGTLIYFKYTNFLLENINALLHSKIDMLYVIMPIGISFYIFQSMSYLIDVYRKECNVQKNYCNLVLYIVLFPQMIAGPIVKYHDVENQILTRESSLEDVSYGIRRFIAGLAKKVLIANTMGAVVEKIFALSPASLPGGCLWLGAVAYSLQLFFDFSGYSDMAIGLGRMFGFRFLENFNYPYISKSITEFWRRWHISLSTWFKEYLYIPLGGNRKGPFRTYINLFIVFVATGIWHGASCNFVFWGLWLGFFIIVERLFNWHQKPKGIVLSVFAHLYTTLVFMIGWVMFRAETMGYACQYIQYMFGIGQKTASPHSFGYFFSPFDLAVMFVAILCSVPVFKWLLVRHTGFGGKVLDLASDIWLLLLFVLSVASIANATFNPFIYFRF